MILVDTSSWIHFLRTDGNLVVRDRVCDALSHGQARLCPIVQLELWNGSTFKIKRRDGSGGRYFDRSVRQISRRKFGVSRFRL